MKQWWERGPLTFEGLLIALVIMLLILFAGLLAVNTIHAAGCLSIDVPPQAVLGNHDGDTFAVFSVVPGGVIKYRVEGVNTPEMSKKKGVPDEPGAPEAKEFTRQWLAAGIFQLSTCGKPTLDRIVAKVARNGLTLADALKREGLVK